VITGNHNFVRVLLIPEPVYEVLYVFHGAIIRKVTTMNEHVSLTDV
jgi:hypothetical protein